MRLKHKTKTKLIQESLCLRTVWVISCPFWPYQKALNHTEVSGSRLCGVESVGREGRLEQQLMHAHSVTVAGGRAYKLGVETQGFGFW